MLNIVHQWALKALVGGFCKFRTELGWLFPPVFSLCAKLTANWLLNPATYFLLYTHLTFGKKVKKHKMSNYSFNACSHNLMMEKIKSTWTKYPDWHTQLINRVMCNWMPLRVYKLTNFLSVILKVFVIDLTGSRCYKNLLTEKKTVGAMKLWGQDQHWIGLNNLVDGKDN